MYGSLEWETALSCRNGGVRLKNLKIGKEATILRGNLSKGGEKNWRKEGTMG